MKLIIHWLRRDLRLDDNRALLAALDAAEARTRAGEAVAVQPLFIFDDAILSGLPQDDARVTFIHDTLSRLNDELQTSYGSGLLCVKGSVMEVWQELLAKHEIAAVFFGRDHEPATIERDKAVAALLQSHGVEVRAIKDQTIFERGEVMKDDGTPYTVFTPYKKCWLRNFDAAQAQPRSFKVGEVAPLFAKGRHSMPTMETIGFRRSEIVVPPFDPSIIRDYAETRNTPSISTTRIGPHLRFGTVSIRRVIQGLGSEDVYLSELIWREFFMQILFHFPQVVTTSFKPQYDRIPWRNDLTEFEAWKAGRTGYPMVDAGMRELNATGYMHNRVRMVTASFLCKHLLIDWRWGEAYFAEKLLDYDLSSNNGNWQWAAGTGCDAAPYFRVFNPSEQVRKFDPKLEYVRRWVPEYDGVNEYLPPLVEHFFGRDRALETYKRALETGA